MLHSRYSVRTFGSYISVSDAEFILNTSKSTLHNILISSFSFFSFEVSYIDIFCLP